MSLVQPALLAAAFGGGKTIGESARPGGVKVGRYDPTFPSLDYLSPRYGLSDRTAPTADHPTGEEMTRGPIAGPEGQGRGALQLLQLAIDSQAKVEVGLSLPGMPPGSIATEQDAVDATFVAVGGTNYWSRYVSPILALVQSGPPVVTPPGLGGGKTPAPPAPTVTSKLSPLSPASARVEELRGLMPANPIGQGALWAAIIPLFWRDRWIAVKPFAVEALRLYRRVRAAKFGDTREIPQEDR